MSFEQFVRDELPLRQVTFKVSGDPTTGAGYGGPLGSYYLDTSNNYKRYVKTGFGDNDWELVPTASDISSGGGGGGTTLTSEVSGNWESTYNTVQSISAIHTQVFTRGSLSIDMQANAPIYISLQESNFAADSYWTDLNPKHVMVLPYETRLKKVQFRSTGTAGEKVAIGFHTNRDVTNTTSEEYKFFEQNATETQVFEYSQNYESHGYTFTDAASARAGDTLGLSVSATGDVGLASMTIVLDFIKD